MRHWRVVFIVNVVGVMMLSGCMTRSDKYGIRILEESEGSVYTDGVVSDNSDAFGFAEETISASFETEAEDNAENGIFNEITSATDDSYETSDFFEFNETTSIPASSDYTDIATVTTPATSAPPQTTATPSQTTTSKPQTTAAPPQTTTSKPQTTTTTSQTPAATSQSASTAANSSTTSASAGDEPKDISVDEYITEVIRLVNIERDKEGLQPLESDDSLNEAAQVRAEEQIELFGHSRPDGESCFTVLSEYNIFYMAAGENVAAGYPTPAAVVEGWMNSSGHRANILSSSFDKMGIGIAFNNDSYGVYWAQLFIG